MDVFFLTMGAAMVLAMHAGFAFLELGTVRKVFGSVKAALGLRLSEEDEHQGADLSIHKIAAYPEEDMFNR